MKTIEDIETLARGVFEDSYAKYGPSFTDFRVMSLTDQIFIKLFRIKTLENSEKKVNESVEDTYLGAMNYSIISIMVIKNDLAWDKMTLLETLGKYNAVVNEIKSLREEKNHDYGEAWKFMRIQSLTDIMIVKIKRLKKLEDESPENIEARIDCYRDIVNYCIYSLMKI